MSYSPKTLSTLLSAASTVFMGTRLDMPKFARGRISRLVSTTILAAALLPAATSESLALDPVTVGAGLSVAQTILSFGHRGPDLNLQATLASLEMLRALHQRLDGIETGIKATLKLVADIPEQVRQDMDRDRDIVRSETVKGRGETIRDLLSRLQATNGFGSWAKAAQIKADLHRLRLDFQNEINSLFDRSDFVAPYITAAMAIELATAQAEGADSAEIAQRLHVYDARLAAMQDAERSGSLAALCAAMERAQSEDEKKIAKALNAADGPIVAGDLEWYAYVQMAKRPVKHLVHYPGVRGFIDGPPDTWEEIEVDEPYPKEVHVWRRKVTKTPLDYSAGLYELKVEPVGGEAQAGDRPGIPHVWNAAAELKQYADGNASLLDTVRIYNERAHAIRVLRDIDGVVSMGRTLASNWNPILADELMMRSAATETNKVAAFDHLRQLDREIEVNRASAVIDENQKAGRARVDAADADLRRAFNELHANKWRSDVMMFLQVAQASVQAWRFVDSLLPTAETKQASSQHEGLQTEGPKSEVRAGVQPKAAPDRQATATPSSRAANFRNLTDFVRRDLDRTAKTPASAWSKLPEGLTDVEAKLVEIKTRLDLLDAEAAKRSGVSSSDLDAWTEGAKRTASGDYFGAIRQALAPSVAEADEIGGFRDRNALRQQLNDQLLDYQARRAKDYPAGAPHQVDRRW